MLNLFVIFCSHCVCAVGAIEFGSRVYIFGVLGFCFDSFFPFHSFFEVLDLLFFVVGLGSGVTKSGKFPRVFGGVCIAWIGSVKFVTIRVVLFPIVIYRLVDYEIGFAGELKHCYTKIGKKTSLKFGIRLFIFELECY